MYTDYSFCQAARFGAKEEHLALPITLAYDIGCDWSKNFYRRAAQNDTLRFDQRVGLSVAVGKWHLASHVEGCYNKFSLNYMKGVGHMDGEIMETVWSQLNGRAIGARCMTLGHRRAVLNRHIGDMNFKKMISMGM